MNAKTCKRLRREARAQTVGQPARRLVWGSVVKRDGKHINEGRAVSAPKSTRGVYRKLKREARA